ncbi:hypothetical protein GGX14DRAFT_564191 [Mycena pura]|uniref:Uncharacterized protein n=1 Tax=Mycena pura TaxID=153505 RepID=A0AAD6VHL7_9AGAR|nr:hypothetical protein GGX14DRAFT_564191 [Mycena pura]
MDEARFAGAHELALCLRGGTNAAGRKKLAMNNYVYPPTAFSTFIDSLQLDLIMGSLFALCVCLVAHSAASRHTWQRRHW